MVYKGIWIDTKIRNEGTMGKIEAILFDLDGTLWDSADGVLKTWNMVIEKHPECGRGLLTSEELGSYFGLPMTEIARRMFVNSTTEEQKQLMDECCELENNYLSEHGGILFPKLEETLAELKKHYKLFVVSNCQSGYIEAFIKAHKLEQYFDDTQCWGDNMVPKGENNKYIMQRNGIQNAIYVGDTAGDEESARVAEIPFVFAAYGFGEAVAPDYTIEQFSDLPTLMQSISEK